MAVVLAGMMALSGCGPSFSYPNYEAASADVKRMVASHDPIHIPTLIAGLRHKDERLQKEVAEALATFGAPAVKPLMDLCHGGKAESFLRDKILPGMLSSHNKPRLKALQAHAMRRRQCILLAISLIRDPEALPDLLANVDDPARDVQLAVIRALGGIRNAEACEPLAKKLQDSKTPADIRIASAKALQECGYAPIKDLMLKAAMDTNSVLWMTGIEYINKTRPREALDVLLPLLNNADSWLIGNTVVATLGHLGSSQAIKPLFDAYDRGPGGIRATIDATLHKSFYTQIGVTAMIPLMDDPRPEVKKAASNHVERACCELLSPANHVQVRRFVIAQAPRFSATLSWNLMARGLHDPSPDVKADALAAIKSDPRPVPDWLRYKLEKMGETSKTSNP